MNNKINLLLIILIISIVINILLLATVIRNNNKLISKNIINTKNSLNPVSLALQNNSEEQKITADQKGTFDKQDIFNQINPPKGFDLKIPYGNLGPKMISLGVIDADKFKEVLIKSNEPLSKEKESILFNNSSQSIKITQDNSRFLLNFFWALGLANKTKILTDGEMVTYGGKNELGSFASTGGWSLGKKDAMNYYGKTRLILLTPKQEELVNSVASKIYRPCCNNSTAFPDCNHGMALLGVLELLASNNATEKELYNAAKYFNAFWFPGNYFDLALYFKNKENKNFEEIDPKIILSKEYSSATGWKNAKSWLINQKIVQEPPKSGSGCGV